MAGPHVRTTTALADPIMGATHFGYTFTRLLGRGATSAVYRAEKAGADFAVKVTPRSMHGGVQVLRREWSAVARINHPGVVKVVDVQESADRCFFVMELVEGENLAEILQRGPLREQVLLELARSATRALAEAHRRGLVHRDIKPANLMVTNSGTAKLIDFGFATVIGDGGAPTNMSAVGTFLYCPPEQTGMVKRRVDGRADLYSLGAVLFEAASGRPPFDAPSAAELLRHHVVTPPPSLLALVPSLRPAFADIVAKLLRKDPDDRYQSAAGLLADLLALDELDEQRARGEEVVLGRHDVRVGSESIPLVGRGEELAALTRYWELARTGGGGAALLLEGEGGSGKTRLVRELVAQVPDEGALVLKGKAQKGEGTPLAPLRQAIDEHMSVVTRMPEAERNAAITRLRAAAGEFGSIIKRLSRALEPVFAQDEELRPLSGAGEQERFYDSVAAFFVALAAEHGCALLQIDDAQWFDDATTEVVARISRRLSQTPMLIAVTARNDADSRRAVDTFVKAVGSGLKQRFVLRPLEAAAVGELVSAHLGGPVAAPELIERLAHHANGNPFAIGEYVRTLLETGGLRPSPEGWIAGSVSLRELALPSDVVELLLARLERMEPASVRVLSMAAIVGFEFEKQLLVDAMGGDEAAVDAAVEEGLEGNLLEAVGAGYRFVHDRVSEAFLARPTDEERKDIHQALAEAIEQRTGDDSSARQHLLARCYAGGHSHKNPRRLFETSLRAGANALQSFSNEEAFTLLERALSTAKQIGVEGEELARVEELIGLACTRTGRGDAGHAHLRVALAAARTDDARARIHFLEGDCYKAAGRLPEAWAAMQQAMRLLKAPLPRTKAAIFVTGVLYWAWAIFCHRTGLFFGGATGKERARREALSRIYDSIAQFLYLMDLPLEHALITMRQLSNVQFIGVTSEAAKAHVHYGYLMANFGMTKSARYHTERANSMAALLGDPEAIVYCQMFTGCALSFGGDNVRGLEEFRRGIDQFLRLGARDISTIYLGAISRELDSQGRAREAAAHDLANLETLLQGGEVTTVVSCLGFLSVNLAILGDLHEARKYSQQLEAHVSLPAYARSPRAQKYYHYTRMAFLAEIEEFGAELEKHIRLFERNRLEEYYTRTGCVTICNARLEAYERTKGDAQKRAALKRFTDAISALEVFPRALSAVHRCHLWVARAAVERINGRYAKALRFLERARLDATAARSPWGLWAMNRERARLASRQGDQQAMLTAAMVAHHICRENGWVARARRLVGEFGLDVRSDSSSSMTASASRSSKYMSRHAGQAERYSEALLEVSLASATTLDPLKQATSALDTIIKVLGAERACLFVDGDAGHLKLWTGRQADGTDIHELRGYSSTVVNKVRESSAPVIVTGTDEGEVLGSESAVLHDLRSIMAAPVVFRERFIGVIYLDSQVVKGLFSRDDVDVLQAVCNHIAVAMEMGRMARFEVEQQALAKDLEVTAAVQSLFLPRSTTLRTACVDVAGMYRPAGTCGGDWWWHEARDGVVSVHVADVTGHGVGPAMVTASLASFFRSARALQPEQSPEAFFSLLNTMLTDVAQGGYLATAAAVVIDESAGKLRFMSAGAPPVIVVHSDGRTAMLSAQGAPLGSGQRFDLGTTSFELTPGDRIVIFTDGIYECDVQGRQLGMKRLLKMVGSATGGAATDALQKIMGEVDGLRDAAFDDDVTLCVIDWHGPRAHGAAADDRHV